MSRFANTEILARMMRDINQSVMQDEAERDKQNKVYSSVIFENGAHWRYWEMRLASRRVRYCYTTTPNCTGCFLTFIETIIGRKVKRSKIVPHATRRGAKAWTLKEYQKAKAKMQAAKAQEVVS